MIKVENISRRYGDFVAVDNVSFTIGQGEIVGLLGHNGAGKTTIMKMLTGFIEPSAGTIFIKDHNIEDNAEEAQALIGYLPENLPVYPEMPIIEYLFYCAKVRNIPEAECDAAVAVAIAKTELQDKALQPISTLSRGYKQRVGVAQALLHNPKLLILDEPTNGLDPHQTNQMRHLIKNLSNDATVIVSTHIMQEVDALCDRVLILDSGDLAVDQTMDELRKSDSITVETDASKSDLDAILAVVTKNEIDLVSESNGVNKFILSVSEEDNIQTLCAAISEKLIEQKAKLYSLSPNQQDLETVFRNIHENKEGRHAA